MREAVAQLQANGTLRGTFGAAVAAEVGRGLPLSEALARFPDEVPQEDVALLEAGEGTGNLDRSLERAADRHEARRSARRRFLTETAYPIVLFHMAAFLTPLAPSLARDGRLFGPSWFSKMVLVLVPFYALVTTAVLLQRRACGRALLRRVVGALPGFGNAARRRRHADLAEILGAAYEAGMRIDRALRVAGRAVEDPRVTAAADEVARGRTLREALGDSLPPQLLARIATGEQAGDLSRALKDIAREEAEAADHIQRRTLMLTSKAVYIGVAGWIAFYAVSTMLGIYGGLLG